jgi:ribonuclease BN (tRNA processing enzyme)
LQAHVFNDVLWPTMSEQVGSYYPLTWHTVEAGSPFELLGYTVTPIEMSHSVPTVGYLIEKDGSSFFYTADTRAQDNPSWAETRPDLLIAETTMASEYEHIAAAVGHMTPLSLGTQLRAFHARQGYYPPTVCVHINPHHEPAITSELAALASELGAQITAGREGMLFTI